MAAIAATYEPPDTTGADSVLSTGADSVRSTGAGLVLSPAPEVLDSVADPPVSEVPVEPLSDEPVEPVSEEELELLSVELSVEPVELPSVESELPSVEPAEPPAASSPVPDWVLVRGAWAGARSCVELVPALLGSVARVRVPRTEPVVVLRPGKAVAAAAVKAAVSTALPASSQRLAWLSRRSAASRVRVVWRLLGG
jgi:hypothetical protein